MDDFDQPFVDAPRDEQEIVELFEMLLFMRVPEDFKKQLAMQGEESLRANTRGNEILANSYALNRIFRAWYQYTWGDDSWHDLFDGKTPRQEHGEYDADIESGHAMLSVALSMADPAHPLIVPRLFERNELDAHGGPFCYGLAELDTNPDAPVVAPNFDIDFRASAQALREERMRGSGTQKRTGKKDMTDEETYFRLFWNGCGARIIAPFTKYLSDDERAAYATEVQDILSFYAREQKVGEYIRYDHLSTDIWDVLRKIDPTLIRQEDVYVRVEGEDLKALQKNKDQAHGVHVFYTLHHTIDGDVFFPLDRYFNAVEMVWQDKETFVTTLAMLFGMLQEGRATLPYGRMPKHDLVGRALREAEAALHNDRIERMWFNPCTCIRFLDRVLPFLKEV